MRLECAFEAFLLQVPSLESDNLMIDELPSETQIFLIWSKFMAVSETKKAGASSFLRRLFISMYVIKSLVYRLAKGDRPHSIKN